MLELLLEIAINNGWAMNVQAMQMALQWAMMDRPFGQYAADQHTKER